MRYNKDLLTLIWKISILVYALDFRQLACDINWDEEALMSQFYWGLKDDVKDLILSIPDFTNA